MDELLKMHHIPTHDELVNANINRCEFDALYLERFAYEIYFRSEERKRIQKELRRMIRNRLNKIKYVCSCGALISRGNMYKHRTSQKHINNNK